MVRGTLTELKQYSTDTVICCSQNLWLGGYKDAEGKVVTGFDKLKSYLGPNFELIEDKPMSFFIRETAHKNQWSVAHTTIWKRRKSS